MDSALGSDLAPVLGDLSQSGTLFEIKIPLANGLIRTSFILTYRF